MPVSLQQLVRDLDGLMMPERFNDYCPNGLQVEGSQDVRRLVTGVTASLALIEEAVSARADVLLVHHGYFWRGEAPTLTGIRKRRIEALLANGISLIAYHLPLDVHPEFGNNVQLGRRLGLETTGEFARHDGRYIGLVGRLPRALDAGEFAALLTEKLGREPLVIEGGSSSIQTVAWCTGAAQGYIDQAVEAGVDAYLTGEVSEPTVHIAREAGIHFFSAGHHATERYGVQALGSMLADKYKLEYRFIEIDNPV